MKHPNVRFRQPQNPHAARFKVVAQRARVNCRSDRKIGCTRPAPNATVGAAPRGNGGFEQKGPGRIRCPEPPSESFRRVGRDHQSGLLPSSTRCSWRCKCVGRTVRGVGRFEEGYRTGTARCLPRNSKHAAIDRPCYPTVRVTGNHPCRPAVIEPLSDECPCWTFKSWTSRVFSQSRWRSCSSGLAVEAPSLLCRHSCQGAAPSQCESAGA